MIHKLCGKCICISVIEFIVSNPPKPNLQQFIRKKWSKSKFLRVLHRNLFIFCQQNPSVTILEESPFTYIPCCCKKIKKNMEDFHLLKTIATLKHFY